MKYAGKKMGMMPPKAEKESKKEDKGENEATETKGMIKKTGKTDGKSNKLGSGGRFQQLLNQGKSPALASYIGRRMYGKAKFQKMAAKGRAKASAK